jgi:hypothetical protein
VDKKVVAEKLHATLGASTAARWMACPGSVRLTRDIPNPETEFSREGTLAHALGEHALRTGDPIETYHGAVFDEGTVVGDMIDFVGTYVDYVRERMVEAKPFWIERKFTLASLGHDEMFGTADWAGYYPELRMLEIADLKYGQGVMVDAFENEQLMYYALGALLDLGADYPIDRIRVTIIQPRIGHPDGTIRHFDFSLDDLLGFTNQLLDAAEKTTDPAAPLVAGSHCRFCPAAGICPAQYALAQETAMVEFSTMPVDIPPDPAILPDSIFADMLPKLEILEDWIKAMRNRARERLERGEKIEGFKLVDRRANRKWVDEDKVSIWLEGMGKFSEKDIYLMELRSPAQIEKLVGKKNLPPAFTQKVSSGHVMVPTSDPRPEKAVSAAEEFALLESGD